MSLAVTIHSPAQCLVSLRELEHLLGRDRQHLERIAAHAGRYYKPFDRRRERGEGKWRHIDNPTDELKGLQRRISRNILTRVPLPPTMLGGVSGGSIEKNGKHHCGTPALVTLDLFNCFPRIGDLAVFKVFRQTLGCSPTIADLLTKLTTFQHRLPQGAPSSSALANLVLLPMHQRIVALTDAMGLACTFFVDDIAFSGSRAFEAIEAVIAIIHQYGHAIRRRKTHLMPQNLPQLVAGVGVNSRKVSIDRHRREDIRRRIIQIARQTEILNVELQGLRGHILHVSRFCPGYAARLTNLAQRLLPVEGIAGKKQRRDEMRPCNRAKRHRLHVAPSRDSTSPPDRY